MFGKIKRLLYFPVASYFRFFAAIKLRRWNPRIIVITGSSGKTTLLHLVESQLGEKAKYSHHANSSMGIPFDILGLHRKDLTFTEWPVLFILSPFKIFSPIPKEKIYVVEADCDRPGEGKFLSDLLKPEVTLWTNVSKTHSGNFDTRNFSSIDEAIAFEFGYFAQETKSLVITDRDSQLIQQQLKRVISQIINVSAKKDLQKYEVTLVGTRFVIKNEEFNFPYLLPKEIASSILMCQHLINYLDGIFDKKFTKFKLPPGRSSFFKGIKNVTIVDSTYNANLDSMTAIINMFGSIKAKNKWVVLGDMLEQGKQEEEEHKKLASVVSNYGFERLVLMGPRVSKFTYPELKKLVSKDVDIEGFLKPKEVLDYLRKNTKGGEAILFKGARFLEGVVENLLENKNDSKNLARREKIWEIRRKKWGL